MEIIHRGEIPEKVKFEGTCLRCKSVIRAKHDELTVDYDGRGEATRTGKCPVCSEKMYFNRKVKS